MEMPKGSTDASARLTTRMEVLKVCSSEMCAMVSGGVGAAQSLAHLWSPLEELLQQR